MATEPDTRAIVARVLAGEVEAYADLVRAHQGAIWRVVAFALRDRAGTEDLVQQVFVTAYLKLDRFDVERDFGAWLRTIARNLVRNELRRQARETKWLGRYRDYLSQRIDESTEAEAREQALHQHLQNCRAELSEPAQQALRLRYDQSRPFEEIAERLGRTVAATRQLLSRVRLALRRCLEERRAHA